MADVRERGDAALRDLTARYDGVDLESVVVDPEDVASAPTRIDPVVLEALEVAATAIRRHHEGQRRAEHRTEEDGLCVRSISRPVQRAGCYAPGGRAAYPSTVLMTAVPARVAGVADSFDHEMGKNVDATRRIAGRGRGIDHAQDLDHPLNAIVVTEMVLQCGQHIESDQPRSLVCLLLRTFGWNLAGHIGSTRFCRAVPRNKNQVPYGYRTNIRA